MTFIQLGNSKNSKEEKEALISEKNMMNHFAKLYKYIKLFAFPVSYSYIKGASKH